MKNTLVVLLIMAGLAGGVASAAAVPPPSLQFSDLTSGPATGGKDNLGAIVTVVGKNFGAQQNNSYVTVGGARAAAYLFWSDTKVSFQPGGAAVSGDIRVTTGGGTSNGLKFTVRPGNIYFVDDNGPSSPGSGTFADPWRNQSSFLGAMKPGDILYFRGGGYGRLVLGSGQANGTTGNEIVFAGYPGETAQITGGTNVDFQNGKAYFTIAGLSLYSRGKNISVTGHHIRIVNNDIEGLKTHVYGMIHPTVGNNIQIYGNAFHGATSGNKLDHPVYVGYGADHVDIGWNRFFDNNVDRGPVISINTDGAQQAGYRFENIRIHDNTIDVNGARGIGVVSTQAGSSVFIYNNVFTGNNPLQTVYAYSGSVFVYNNVFYGSPGGATIQLTPMNDGSSTYYPETVDIRNNIIYNLSGGRYFEITGENRMKQVTIANNAYYGAGAGPSRDSGAVNADPRFVDPAKGGFFLLPTSPCLNAGSDVSSVVAFDKDGYARLQEGAVDIGAYERGTAQPTGSSSGDVGTANGDPSGPADSSEPPVPVAELPVPMNGVLVLGSSAGRGTINPEQRQSAKIYFRGRETGTYYARIFTLTGELVWEKVKESVSEGVFEWVPESMASAVYVVNVRGPGLEVTKKLAVLK